MFTLAVSCLEVVNHKECEHVAGHRCVLSLVHTVLPGPSLERTDLRNEQNNAYSYFYVTSISAPYCTYEGSHPPVALAVAEEEVCVSHTLVSVHAEVDGRVLVEKLEEGDLSRYELDIS